MVNVSRGKNEYGHHLLGLSVRSVHACVCVPVCVYDNHADKYTHTQCALGEGFGNMEWKKGQGGRKS